MNITRLNRQVNQRIRLALSDLGLIAHSLQIWRAGKLSGRAASFLAQYISHCANRMQKSNAAIRFEFFPQVADRYVYNVRQRVEVLVPHMLGQLRAADHSLRVSEEI